MSPLRHDQERVIRAGFALARSLEPTDQEVARVVARTERAATSVAIRTPRRRSRPRPPLAGRWRRALGAGACAIVLLGAGYGVAAPVRSAVDTVAGTFSGWIAGHPGRAPGRALRRGDNAPAYMRDPRLEHQPRVIAEDGGYELFAARERGDVVNFDLGNTGYGTGMLLDDQFFQQHVLFVLGPGAMQYQDRHGHVPLFGITALSVRTILLTYTSGPPERLEHVHGAFVLLAEPARGPVGVIAVDARGRIIARQLVDDSHHSGPQIIWRHYIPPAP
jgi:hypothetical protein